MTERQGGNHWYVSTSIRVLGGGWSITASRQVEFRNVNCRVSLDTLIAVCINSFI